MSKLTFYIDGSETRIEKKVRQGWGVVARHFSGNSIEINGFVEHDLSDRQRGGYYELLAFYHAVLHAEKNNVDPEQTSFYTDCSWVAYSGFHLERANKSNHRSKIYKRLKTFQKLFYPKDKHAVIKLMRWLALSQMHWVKGHKQIIDNCRADYLARAAVREKKVMKFHVWIANGFGIWDNINNCETTWYPPFSADKKKKVVEDKVSFKWCKTANSWEMAE